MASPTIDELIERLRGYAAEEESYGTCRDTNPFHQAAQALASQRDEIVALREALKPFAGGQVLTNAMFRRARSLLNEENMD